MNFFHRVYSFDYIQLGLCTYPLAQESIEYFSIDEKMASIHKNANPEISAFIHELLAHHGVQNAETISIKLGKEYCSGNSILMIEWLDQESNLSLLESLIIQYNSLPVCSAQENLLALIYQQIGSIEHEITHIKNHDCKKRMISLAFFSLLTYGITKWLEQTLPQKLPFLQALIDSAQWKSKLCYSLGSGLLLRFINKHMLYKICRNQERNADAGISDNGSILLAKVNLHTAIYENDKQQVEKGYGKLVSWVCQKFPSLYLFFDWEHPTSFERAKTFAQRLVKILNHENQFNSCSIEADLS